MRPTRIGTITGLDSGGYAFMLLRMRTTIDIEDELAILAKKEAAQRRTSLKSLVEQGLRRVLKVRTETASNPVRRMDGLGKDLWAGVNPDRYVREAREGWS
jgi:hypothetical protein